MALPLRPAAVALFLLALTATSSCVRPCSAFVFTLLKNECFKHFVPEDKESVHVSFVAIKQEFHWGGSEQTKVDLKVEDARGHVIRHSRARSEDSFTFTALHSGFYSFCFETSSPVHESIAFDVQNGHKTDTEGMAKNDQIDPLVKEVSRLHDEVWRTQHEIHYSFYLAEQHAAIDKATARRVMMKAVLQALALIGCGFFQVYLLHQLFEKKLRQSFV